jgi:hypothetical protein
VLGIITAIVIFLGAFGLLGWIFSQRWQRGHAGPSCSAMQADWHDWKHLDRPQMSFAEAELPDMSG